MLGLKLELMKTVESPTTPGTELSALVDTLAGEEVVPAKGGKPVVRIAPIDRKLVRQPGAMKGQVWVSDHFDDPPPDIARAFGAEE